MATVADLRRAIVDGESTAAEICERYLNRIKAVDSQLNAFTSVLAVHARAHANASR